MKIDKLLIIPDKNNPEESKEIAEKYGCCFEYNEFANASVLDDEELVTQAIQAYKRQERDTAADTLHGAFLDVTVFSEDPKIREISDLRVEQSIQAARLLGVKGVIFHTNYMPNFHLKSYEDKWVEDNAVYWHQKLKTYEDIEIYIENMFDMEPTLCERLGERMKDEPRFGICLDYAHACVFGASVPMEEWIARLAPYVRHLHINDNDLFGDLHLPIGEGNIDWEQFKMQYNTYLKGVPVLVEVTGAERIRTSVEYLKTL